MKDYNGSCHVFSLFLISWTSARMIFPNLFLKHQRYFWCSLLACPDIKASSTHILALLVQCPCYLAYSFFVGRRPAQYLLTYLCRMLSIPYSFLRYFAILKTIVQILPTLSVKFILRCFQIRSSLQLLVRASVQLSRNTVSTWHILLFVVWSAWSKGR